MSQFVNKRSLIVLTTTIACGGALRLIGFGFGREAALARFVEIRILGSDVYSGTWLLFMCTFFLGVGVPYAVVRYGFGERLRDYGMSLGNTTERVRWILFLYPVYLLLPLGSAYIGTDSYYT